MQPDLPRWFNRKKSNDSPGNSVIRSTSGLLPRRQSQSARGSKKRGGFGETCFTAGVLLSRRRPRAAGPKRDSGGNAVVGSGAFTCRLMIYLTETKTGRLPGNLPVSFQYNRVQPLLVPFTILATRY
jgi:hypothetical protein